MMRPNVLKFSMALLILMFTTISIFGQPYTKEKRIVKSFPLFAETEIEISNKYGDITLEEWDKDSIRVEIHYKVSSNKESKLEKTFNAIDFDFRANKYYVVVNTEIEGGDTFWSDVSDIASNLFSGGTHTSIDYKVYAPAKQFLTLKLKYGNIYMANHKGSLSIDLSNGNLKAHHLSGDSELEVEFGDATIDFIAVGVLKLNYANITIEEAETLNFNSQSSEIEIEEVQTIILDSKRDKFNIDEVESIEGSASFSRINLNELKMKADLTTKYGSIKIKDIDADCEGIKLNSTNTTVNLYLNESDSYRIQITSNEKSDITYSAKLGEFRTETLSEKDKILIAKAMYGNANSAIPLNVEVYSGLLSIKLEN